MVHLGLLPPLTRCLVTCSSTWISGLVALHCLSQPPNACFVLAEAEAAGVLGTDHLLLVADLGHRSPGPVCITTILLIFYCNNGNSVFVCVVCVLALLRVVVERNSTFLFISWMAIFRMLSTTSTLTSFLFLPMSQPRG
jgi:hypothetical protein